MECPIYINAVVARNDEKRWNSFRFPNPHSRSLVLYAQELVVYHNNSTVNEVALCFRTRRPLSFTVTLSIISHWTICVPHWLGSGQWFPFPKLLPFVEYISLSCSVDITLSFSYLSFSFFFAILLFLLTLHIFSC